MEPPAKLCECGCGEPAVYAAKHCHGRMRGRISSTDWKEIDCGYETPCWIWKGQIDSANPYRNVRVGGKQMVAHRAVYMQFRGPIPDGLVLDHLCRTTRCVNPDHLDPVTVAENTRRGRTARLTAEEVQEIRESAESARELGARFGVTDFNIYMVRRGEIWRDIA